MVSVEVWKATLIEVKRQALLYLEDADWVHVKNDFRAMGSTVWPAAQWQTALEILFCQIPLEIQSLQPHKDDLLFFVLEKENIVIPRRRSTQLPQDVDRSRIDWRASVLLNIVIQTEYKLSVIKCLKEDIDTLTSEEQEVSCTMVQVARRVFAAPTKSLVNVDDSRHARNSKPVQCYPDITFAVDDFHHVFKSVVLGPSQEDCFCVLLHGHISSSWLQDDTTEENVLLFSGFVSHSQLEIAIGSKIKTPLLGGSGASPQKLIMKGPGGRGAAEVVVSKADADLAVDTANKDQPQLLRFASKVARGLAEAAKNLAQDNVIQEDIPLIVRVALMTLCLPVESLAATILTAL